jgi:hypothetical protein
MRLLLLLVDNLLDDFNFFNEESSGDSKKIRHFSPKKPNLTGLFSFSKNQNSKIITLPFSDANSAQISSVWSRNRSSGSGDASITGGSKGGNSRDRSGAISALGSGGLLDGVLSQKFTSYRVNEKSII